MHDSRAIGRWASERRRSAFFPALPSCIGEIRKRRDLGRCTTFRRLARTTVERIEADRSAACQDLVGHINGAGYADNGASIEYVT